MEPLLVITKKGVGTLPNCCALNEIIDFNKFGDWNSYENKLYSIFHKDFIYNSTIFNDKRVQIRKHPIVYEKEQTFFHITSTNYSFNGDPNDRIPDFRRCERIHWIRPMIEINSNSTCGLNCLKIWPEKMRGKVRTNILNEKDKFLVVLEEREEYVLLITAFYIDRKHTLQKKLKSYNKYLEQLTRMQKTP